MASRSVHIADYAEALGDGTFPGAFSADRTVYEFPAVESLNARGARLVWVLRVRLRSAAGAPVPFAPEFLAPGAAVPAGTVAELATESFQVSAAGARGKVRAGGTPTVVRAGKNRGRANATNAATQALRDALGRYRAQARRAHARAGPQPPPMLVKKLGSTRGATLTPATFARGVTVQRKLNGVRLVAYRGPPGVRLYSRAKGDYPGLAHVRRELLRGLLRAPPAVPPELLAPPPGCPGPAPAAAELAARAYGAVHLDGEVYLHGRSLRWISGQARRARDEKSLEFHVFDCFWPAAKAVGHDMASASRQAYLGLLFAAAGPPQAHVKRVENFPAADLPELEALRDRFLAEGFEGAIARKDCAGYRYSFNGYHSDNVVKLKPKFDSEFEVVGFTQGAKGKDVGAVIWVCEVDPAHVEDAGDKTFSVVPKDVSYADRYRIFRCLGAEVDNAPEAVAAGGPARVTRFVRDFRGRPLTVEYPERSSKTGKPTQAKALAFRTYEGGPQGDPLRRLFAECE